MPRPRRSVALLCIAVIACAAFLPGVSTLDYTTFEPSWILLPDLSSIAVHDLTPPVDEQPISLLSLRASRAPPLTVSA